MKGFQIGVVFREGIERGRALSRNTPELQGGVGVPQYNHDNPLEMRCASWDSEPQPPRRSKQPSRPAQAQGHVLS
jgi:hypothetical protein